MMKDLQVRFAATILALISVAACVFAWINYQKERQTPAPYDGVVWVVRDGIPTATKVDTAGPAARAGLKTGDQLTAVNGVGVTSDAAVSRQIYRSGVWSKANYALLRNGVALESHVFLEPADKGLNNAQRLIALVYLGIGLYVLLRRWTAPKATHFYLFCLTSFILYSFHYIGKFNAFDWIVYWANVVAWLLQPALFLHFVLTFPQRKAVVERYGWIERAVYLPGAILLAMHLVALRWLAPSETLRWNLDRVHTCYLTAMFVAATAVLWDSYRDANTPIFRQQMKWVTRGTVLAIAPFTLLYALPFTFGVLPTALMKMSVISLIFLPLTFGYAIFRYRLMDVDLIFKRGMAYTLAAAAILVLYFGLVAAAAEFVHASLPSAGPWGLIIPVVVTALLFNPIRDWIQERLDRFFYRKRYDYRRTLVEFGRELSSETDLDKMLSSVVERLSATLEVDRAAVFLADPQTPAGFVMAKTWGMGALIGLDLSFLGATRPEQYTGHLFFDNTHQAVRETPAAQETISRLDLNYYIPCKVQGRTIAMLGLGKTAEGDFLSSEDVELLETLAGYIGIAIQNARLFASLEQKVAEYERLKDFNENIVESISVGVLAVDLDDRVEFWNSQMEVTYALPRADALGRKLSEVFPANFVEEFYRTRTTAGIHNLYKFRMATLAGDARIANIAIAPLVTRRFNVIGRLIIVDDITERLDLESQLTQAEKMSSIGLMAAGVAHEVNTPLAVISSYAQMLAKQLQGDEQKSVLLEKIKGQSFRASEIVNNLLNFSRTGASEFGAVDLNKIITDTLGLLEHQLKTARVSVRPELTPDLPPIHGNAGKLQQVFLNLFLNAKDAMPGGGTLAVSTQNGFGVSVTVRDTGSGIAPEHVNRIYDPFFTTKTAPRDGQGRGTGLGLSVTYGIIQEHAGKIQVDSRPGEGTAFHLEFPLIRKAVNV